ncbi:major facilitator superfamily domain-containing protein [Aspergillus sergii]|uniref:Major facilitator superfamily domain-containing protein n=1 Tax=Aspergillus sergii TaxID=1034303 RepID=A0A5N6WUA4_9EURO|nr:major facilitator superfamily domain-containing protein [Aspergillus sergii]
MSSSTTKSTEVSTASASPPRTVDGKGVDEAFAFIKRHGDGIGPLSFQALGTLKRKLIFSILGLLLAINLMLFIDKATLGYAVLLGLMEETHIGNEQYNNLNTLFYVGYVIGQIPGQYLIQRIPLRVYVSGSVFLWSAIIFLHCTARDYGGLIALRLVLGLVESTVVPALEMTMTMFFTPEELHALQPIFWISCVGSPIPTGLLGYALLFSKSPIRAWKFFMIATGGLSFLVSLWSWLLYPSNPMTARFLTTEEKVHVIRRVHDSTRSAIEQKVFKRYQAREALLDPVSWLFALSSFTFMLSNNLTFQQSLLYLQIGVSDLGSTLVWVAAGGFAMVVAIIASLLLKLVPNYSAYWTALWCLPAIAGGIGMIALPWDRTIPLLACLLLACNTWGMTYIISLGWTASSCAGYTKKLTRSTMFMAAYGVSNIISPQMWKRGVPRYYGTWIVQIVISWTGTAVVLLVIRWILARRNKERKVWIEQQIAAGNLGTGFVEGRGEEEGRIAEVDISMLDLTDLENKFFIYPL